MQNLKPATPSERNEYRSLIIRMAQMLSEEQLMELPSYERALVDAVCEGNPVRRYFEREIAPRCGGDEYHAWQALAIIADQFIAKHGNTLDPIEAELEFQREKTFGEGVIL